MGIAIHHWMIILNSRLVHAYVCTNIPTAWASTSRVQGVLSPEAQDHDRHCKSLFCVIIQGQIAVKLSIPLHSNNNYASFH